MRKPASAVAGSSPGLRSWTIEVLEKAAKEGAKILTKGQYEHVLTVVARLADFGNRAATQDLAIEKMEQNLWELKDKGGPLGKKNIRVFFTPVDATSRIVVVGIEKKEAEHQTPRHIIMRMRNRVAAIQQRKGSQ